MTTLTLTHSSINSGNPVYVQAKSISQTINKTVKADSNANYSAAEPVVRAQDQSVANPIYSISGIVLYDTGATINGVTALTDELLKDFLMLALDDSNPIILNYSDADDVPMRSLQKHSGVRTADIPVTFSGQVKIDSSITDTNAKLFTVNTITLMETKKV